MIAPTDSTTTDIDSGVEMMPFHYPDPHAQPTEPRQPLPPGWTYSTPNRYQKLLHGKEIHSGIPALRFQTYGSNKDLPIEQPYLERLQPRQWLPNCLVDFYLTEVANTYFEGGGLERMGELCLLPTQVFYSVQETKGKWAPHTLLDKWESALEHTHIAFPMNARATHWLLGIVTHASDLLQEVNPDGPIRSSVVILNSISGYNPANLEARVRQMISRLAIGKPLRPEGLKCLRFFYPAVPQQPNTVDCGLYPGHFLSAFLSDPSRFADHCTGVQKISGTAGEVWKASLIPTTRETLRELVESLAVVRRASLAFHSGRTPSDCKAST